MCAIQTDNSGVEALFAAERVVFQSGGLDHIVNVKVGGGGELVRGRCMEMERERSREQEHLVVWFFTCIGGMQI